jgi:hypothetical protein
MNPGLDREDITGAANRQTCASRGAYGPRRHDGRTGGTCLPWSPDTPMCLLGARYAETCKRNLAAARLA